MSAARATGLEHRPVMVEEMIEMLKPAAAEVFVDGTFGGGGHSRALLAAAACIVWGIDRDPAAVALGRAEAARHGGRLRVIEGAFGDMEALLAGHGVTRVDGVALDLGLSTAPARRSPARLLLPARRPAGHAHGASGADGGRAGQRRRRVRAGRDYPPLRRGTRSAANRPRDRDRAQACTDSPHPRIGAHRPPVRRAAQRALSTRQPAPSRRSESGSTTSSARKASWDAAWPRPSASCGRAGGWR